MLVDKKHTPSCKLWIEYKGRPLIGKGGSEILGQIEKKQSISKAAETLHMSYRYVWNYLQGIGKTIGEPVVKTYKGGKSGGGGARLTELGKNLLNEYMQLEGYFDEVLSAAKYREVRKLKISARNRLKGKVVSIEKDGLMAKVKVEIGAPASVTAIISREAVEDLGIKIGDQAEAVIKATEVMIAK